MVQTRVRVRLSESDGPDPTTIIKVLEQRFSKKSGLVDRDLANLKNKVLDHINMYINANRTRDRKKDSGGMIAALRSSSIVESLDTNKVVLSIGNRDQLTAEVPYWYVLNYGKRWDTGENYVPPKNYGYWGNSSKYSTKNGGTGYSIAGGGKEVWHHLSSPKGGFKSWKLQPNKSVTPMHWLEEMSLVFQIEVDLLEKAYKREIEDKIKKSTEKIIPSTVKKETVVDLESLYFQMKRNLY
jgi:hypothetical protein